MAHDRAAARAAARHAIWSELKPEYDVPNIPTRPFDHGCAASQSIAVARSLRSTSGYSSVAIPADEPVPRRSTRQHDEAALGG